jgi:predicted  nucleic acid-binding Zn-ribbon protein
MTDEELRALVASTAEATARNTESIAQWQRRSDSLDRQLSLLTQQVQTLANSQSSSDIRLIAAERNIQGIYDILQAIAREQSARSQLIDQQIQALIDERRRS